MLLSVFLYYIPHAVDNLYRKKSAHASISNARCYSSTDMLWPPVCVYLTVCVSVCVTSQSSTKTAEWIELFVCMESSVELSYTVLFSGTLSKTPDIENFASASRLPLGAVNKDGRRLYFPTCDG